MVFIPLKFVPGLLLIGGIGLISQGESIGAGLVIGLIGAVWSYHWYLKKA